jgi:hypothetical protein
MNISAMIGDAIARLHEQLQRLPDAGSVGVVTDAPVDRRVARTLYVARIEHPGSCAFAKIAERTSEPPISGCLAEPTPANSSTDPPEHWTEAENNTWRWYERENFAGGRWNDGSQRFASAMLGRRVQSVGHDTHIPLSAAC